MLDDFVNPTRHIHQMQLAEATRRAGIDGLRREARAIARIRDALGHQLIILGERVAGHPERPHPPLDTAA